MRYLIGRYHEIALKGRNQWRFVDQVKQNLRDIFADYRLGNMRSVGPRLLVPIPDEISDEIAAERAALIFGLQNFSLSYSTPRDIESISREAVKRATGNKARTFAVRTKREDKRFAMNSVEIDREVGGQVQEALGFEVDRFIVQHLFAAVEMLDEFRNSAGIHELRDFLRIHAFIGERDPEPLVQECQFT